MIGQDIKYTINLAHGIPVITLNTPLAQGDDRAQKFIFELMNGDDKADTSSLSCTAYFVRGEGQEDSDTISLGGEFSDNILTVELKSGCYTKQTYFVLSVRLIDQNTGIKRTIVFVRGVVRTTQDGSSGDPDESLPSVEEILALMDDVEKAIERANEAAERAENAAGSGGSGGGLPTGGGAYQQLVTDGDGNALWEDRLAYAYTGMVEILPETTLAVNTDSMDAYISEPLTGNLVAGNEYTVTYNGTDYVCKAQEVQGDVVMNCLGNIGAMEGGEGTGEPFVFVQIPPEMAAGEDIYAGMYALDGSSTVTIKIVGEGESVHRLDRKYLPEYIYGDEVKDVVFLSETTLEPVLSENGTSAFVLTNPYDSPLVMNATYTVMWNGTEYKCVPAEGIVNGVQKISLDANGVFQINSSTGTYGDVAYYGVITAFDGATSLTVSINGVVTTVHQVPDKYLPKLNLVNGSAEGSLRSVSAMEENDTYTMGKGAVALNEASRAPGHGAFAVAGGQADGGFSLASGFGSAKKSYSFASGYGSASEAECAAAIGRGVSACKIGSLAIGRANIKSKAGKYLFVIGNGQTAEDVGTEAAYYSDAHTVDEDGNAWYQGRVYVGGTSQEDADYLVTRTELESAVGSGNVIPSYWLTHLNERIPAIRAAMTAAGWKKSAFLWYHDVHWTYGYKRAPMLLKYLYEHTPINKTMFGGDVVDNEGDTSTMTYLWDWRDAVRDIPNHHSVPGNHDDGNTTDNLWDDPYIYAYLLAAEETPDVVRGDAGLYYYIDDPTEKTRYLYIDTATKDGNIINDTAEQAWLVESLKSTPAGWHIVAIAHIWRTVDYDVSPPADAGWSYGGAYCIGEFDKYNARTGEYASCTGKVEFCIGGHTHVDADFVSDGGIPVILTECDSRYVRSGLECIEGTITESSVNAIVADYANGIVNVIRIGRGSSRTVNLDGSGSSGGETPDVPDVPTGDFTNTLTEAGYSEGMRFSNTSLTDVEAAGWDITGYIPATRGDVIRFANVNFLDLDGTGGTSRAMIYLFDANKTYITCSANYAPNNLMSDAWSAVYGDDGDVVQFTIPTSYSSTVAYIRIGARNIDQYSVITVNEPIE